VRPVSGGGSGVSGHIKTYHKSVVLCAVAANRWRGHKIFAHSGRIIKQRANNICIWAAAQRKSGGAGWLTQRKKLKAKTVANIVNRQPPDGIARRAA